MALKAALVRQYSAALTMLRSAIEQCPEDLWLAGEPNRTWHLAYHVLFYTHFYLAPSEAEFRPWQRQRPGYNFLGAPPWSPGEKLVLGDPYTKVELLEYCHLCLEEVKAQVPALDLEAASGFFWLPLNKLELQLYNLRHLAHHTGQLADRLRTGAGLGVPWAR